MFKLKIDNSSVSENQLSELQELISQHYITTLDDLEPELIRRLLKKYHYHQLMTADSNFFQDLLVLLRSDTPKNRIAQLSMPENQLMLSNIQWSAYKYAQVLNLCQSEGITCLKANELLLNLEGFKMVNGEMRKAAIVGIIQPYQGNTNGLDLFDFACRKFEQDIAQNGHSTVFTDSADFPDLTTLLHGFNHISAHHWQIILAFEDIDRHLEFDFDSVKQVEDLLELVNDDRRHDLLVHPGIMEAILDRLSQEDRWLIVEDNPEIQSSYRECIRGSAASELLEIMGTCPDYVEAETVKQIHASIKTESKNQAINLESKLAGLSHEGRWKEIATNDNIKNAFIERIGQGRGDTVLNMLWDNSHQRDSQDDPSITFAVYSAAKEGFAQLDGRQGLSSAQYKMFHFFSHVEPHPFLTNLENILKDKTVCKL